MSDDFGTSAAVDFMRDSKLPTVEEDKILAMPLADVITRVGMLFHAENGILRFDNIDVRLVKQGDWSKIVTATKAAISKLEARIQDHLERISELSAERIQDKLRIEELEAELETLTADLKGEGVSDA